MYSISYFWDPSLCLIFTIHKNLRIFFINSCDIDLDRSTSMHSKIQLMDLNELGGMESNECKQHYTVSLTPVNF